MAAGALLVAGFFAAFGLTSALTGGGDPESDELEASNAQDASATTPVSGAEPASSIGVGVSIPTTGDEPRATETVDPVKDTVRAPCSVDEIRFFFDRETGTLAVFSDDGRPIASVARDSYVFDGEPCGAVGAGRKPYSDSGLQAPVYESAGVSCSAARGFDVEIHPIVSGTTGRQTGNVLVVSVRGRPTVLVSGIVVEDLQGRRFSHSSKHRTRL